MIMRRILLFSMIIIAAVGLASVFAVAADFSVDASQPETIYAGNTTNFSAIITNNGAADWFSIAVIGTYSSWVSVGTQNVFVPSGSSASSNVWVSPIADALPNRYEYSIIVSRASDNSMAENKVYVNVLQSSSVIVSESSLSCVTCNPGESVTASVTLKNIGSRPLSNMKLVFSFGDRTKVMTVSSLDFGAVKTFSTDFAVDPLTVPGDYKVDAKLMQDTSVLVQKSLPFKVPSVSNIKTVKNVSSSIFGNYVTLVSTNYGNAPKTGDVTSDVLNAWFSLYSGPKPSSVGPMYTWTVSLAPAESMTIAYSEIFWPVPVLLVILVFIGAYYYISATSLSLRKRIMHGHVFSEGREVSVSLDVKSGLRPIDNVVVRDFVPKEFSVSEKFETIKPVIRKTPSGTELVWRLGRMKSGEERVLHYRMKVVSAFETARLQPAELNGRRGNNVVSRTSGFVVLHGISEPAKRIKVIVGE